MKILIVDDDSVDRSFIRKNIGAKPSEIVEVETADQAEEAIKNTQFDVLVLDYRLPTTTGLTLYKNLQKHIGDAAVLMVSQIADDDLADACIEAGIQDYLKKQEMTPSRLGNAIRHARQRAKYQQNIVQANRHKSLFFNKIGHELLTPLNAVVGFTDVLLRDATERLNERDQKCLTAVKRNASHMQTLIKGFRDVSRIDEESLEVEFKEVDLRSTILGLQETVEKQADDKLLALNLTLPDAECTTISDRERITQVLEILINNAIKYTECGSVSVSLRETESTLLGLAYCISVVDTGIGISQEQQKEIFSRLGGQIEDEVEMINGAGIGLYLAAKLMRLLKGDIQCESDGHSGSTFSIYFRK